MKHILAATFLLGLAPAAAATEISVTYSPEFTEKLADDYGVREGEYLSERVRTDLEREFAKAGIDPARVEVTIVDAKPSRPTFKQAGDTPGLDTFRSVSIGGMDVSAIAYDAAGNPVGELTYDWYETDIRYAGITTWDDASRASSRFARRFAKTLN